MNKKIQATKRNFCCEICNVEATSQGQLDVHLAGKKHVKKAVQVAAHCPEKTVQPKSDMIVLHTA